MASVEETQVINGARNELSSTPFKRVIRTIHSRIAWLGFTATFLVIYAGWIGRHERNITAENGLGYVLGILGASMMAALLIYPLRKRFPSLSVLGSTRKWFLLHMLLGVIGPVLILYHSNFSVGSLNSRVALFCTLLVACSGIVGRYLYARIHHGLYGGKRNLHSLIEDMQGSLVKVTESGPVIESHLDQLAAIDASVLSPPRNVIHGALRPLSFAFRTRWIYVRMNLRLRQSRIPCTDSANPSVRQHKNKTRIIRRDLRRHLKQVRRVAHLSFYERLFSLWHILHLPFFFMLVISAIVHIIAVHMY